MNRSGTALATRYSYPPNSFALCGPNRQADLSWYARNQKPDLGTEEIIAQFATLYPYLLLIAGENGRKNPFDARIVEAYWTGNALLAAVSPRRFVRYLDETLKLKRKLNSKNRTSADSPYHCDNGCVSCELGKGNGSPTQTPRHTYESPDSK
jgi:hypothetical protein